MTNIFPAAGEYGYNAYGCLNGGGSIDLGLSGPAPPTDQPARNIHENAVLNPSGMLALGDNFLSFTTGTVGGSSLGPGVVLNQFLQRIDVGPVLFGVSQSAERSMAGAAESRHNRSANIVFCDGHVEALGFGPLFQDRSDPALRRWNRDDQPHRTP